jgi:hypothetical protein
MKVSTALCMMSAGLAAAGMQPQLTRAPLQRSNPTLNSPTTYLKRTRVDPRTGRASEYDPKPQLVLLDERAGRYSLRWIGYDGLQKAILYQRPDRIDAVVAADVEAKADGLYRYRYRVRVLPTSGQPLVRFVVQNFANDVRPIPQANLHIGRQRGNVSAFSSGHWYGFAPLQGYPARTPGQEVVVEIESRAHPGLVECRVAGAPAGMDGVGEEPPQELMEPLPRADAWPHGHTIGPIDRLAPLQAGEKAKQLLAWLPEFERLGWMTRERRQRYEILARRTELDTLANEASSDYGAGRITSEVRAVVSGLVRISP